MTSWVVAVAIGLAVAGFQYGRQRAPSGVVRLALGALRAAAIALILALLFNAPLGRPRLARPWVFVDGSLSMTRGGSNLWKSAWDSARAVRGESTFVFGDTLAPGDATSAPTLSASRIRPVVERTMAT